MNKLPKKGGLEDQPLWFIETLKIRMRADSEYQQKKIKDTANKNG